MSSQAGSKLAVVIMAAGKGFAACIVPCSRQERQPGFRQREHFRRLREPRHCIIAVGSDHLGVGAAFRARLRSLDQRLAETQRDVRIAGLERST